MQERIALDLEEPYGRLVFDILSGNRGDHSRNHGFLWGEGGWCPYSI
jgi:serine/threonine protein kinase HipA of HipAB toxin-antitoxin module